MSAWLYWLQQAACSWSLLLALGVCAGVRKPDAVRLLVTAALAGVASLLCALHPSFMLRMVCLVLTSLCAPLAAWPGVPRSQRPRMIAACFVLLLMMAGFARMLHAVGISHTVLILALSVLLPLVSRLLPEAMRTGCITVELCCGGRTVQLTALVDSGNLLCDPITRLPVIVISRASAARLLPAATHSLAPGMRLISVRTISGSTLMQVFRPKRVRLLLARGWQSVSAVVGVSPDGYGGFQALVPSVLLTTTQGGISICP